MKIRFLSSLWRIPEHVVSSGIDGPKMTCIEFQIEF